MVRAVVFDVGETLVDETRIFSRWAGRLGVPAGTFLGLIGACAATDRPLEDAFELARPGLDLPAEIARWAVDDPDDLRENFDADDLYDDVRPALAALRDAGFAVVVAGNQPPQARAALEAMDLPVDSIRTSDEWGVEKPDPRFFAAVAELTGVPPSDIAYVGDRLDNDVLPAADAGMRPVLVRRGPWGYLHATRPAAGRVDVVDSLLELPGLLA
ncbi:HAD superfamily hydrolase (TIGR01509 family)/HAD superfamily hydrolase (TIGR01549 family) [Isoptericola sp. CG 20/1183]|uniref:HAD superfamily hydrolase (TIGR01509 family)/HAD superfamily hydrolase (TIGR01549 family) n=1 Tax=Isoptericola halotolerans TaxID=300560 RepID=A0ABX5EI69_9MICO|nr:MULTISPECIES: HAD family hydrolase [Isoptericola]PRZ09336.1 HAD superfamily hydrolase (TIGR01509 family)/HAD superfamily hydrolase (TIGR01549 family) [Isoptericola sp. CG 20/1183]PRZ10137.1 HAD superfamily hydrolase (TIGR01509 family)/HAD superfamily hydrolase (TIGR01549 family) [Isoptericola halotolerans]